MRSAEGFVVLKRFLLIFSDLIFDSKVDPGKPNNSGDGIQFHRHLRIHVPAKHATEQSVSLNSALNSGLSKRMPFEAGEASRIEASWVPMPPLMSAITGNCVQLKAAVTPGVMATLADRKAPFMGLA
jgi:hypothetical protein